MPNVFNQSLWGDEGFSAILSMKSLPEIIKILIADTSPPLWNIFEWVVFKILGTGETCIRLLSFIFFLGAVFFTYKIGAYLFGKKTGVLAAVLTFLNPFFFTYAFEGRMYSILALGVTASMYFFIKKSWGWYVFWTLWALYSHHFAVFAVFTQGLWFLYEYLFGNRKMAGAFRAFVIVGLGYLPWIYPLYLQVSRVSGGFWLGIPSLTDLRNLIYEYLAEGIKSHPYRIFGVYLHQLALWTTFIILALKKWSRDLKKTLFLLGWFLIPILATWLISQKFTSIFFNRYLLYTVPAATLILTSLRRTRVSVIFITALVISFSLIDWYYFIHPTKIPFRDLAVYVRLTQMPGDLLINEDTGNHKLWESKYYGIPAPIYNPQSIPLPYFVGTALMEDADIITKIPTGTKRLGVITYKKGSELKLTGFKVLEEKSFGDLNFVWLQRESGDTRRAILTN